MSYTLGMAAKATGKSKTTIQRSIKKALFLRQKRKTGGIPSTLLSCTASFLWRPLIPSHMGLKWTLRDPQMRPLFK